MKLQSAPATPKSTRDKVGWEDVKATLKVGILVVLVAAGALLLPGTKAGFTSTTTNDASQFQARSNLAIGGLYRFGYDSTPALTPAQVGTSTAWTQISSGLLHSCGLRSSGQLWCWGMPQRGELGLGVSDDRVYAPVRIGTATWTYIAAGRGLTCGVQTGGTLWCWGKNDFYQLGQGDQVFRSSPTQVGAATNWKMVSQSDRTVCAVRTNGTLWCWGSNVYGQAAQGTITTYVTNPTQVGTDTDWVETDIHYYHGCARKTDNSVWCWASDSNGQQGKGTSGGAWPLRSGSGAMPTGRGSGPASTTPAESGLLASSTAWAGAAAGSASGPPPATRPARCGWGPTTTGPTSTSTRTKGVR